MVCPVLGEAEKENFAMRERESEADTQPHKQHVERGQLLDF